MLRAGHIHRANILVHCQFGQTTGEEGCQIYSWRLLTTEALDVIGLLLALKKAEHKVLFNWLNKRELS